MALSTNTRSNANSIVNHAVGKVVTDSGAAAATTFALGFTPRVVRWHNLTDRISDEWFEGMAADTALHTVAAGTRTLAGSGGLTVNARAVDGSGDSFTVPAALIVASKTFAWEAIG